MKQAFFRMWKARWGKIHACAVDVRSCLSSWRCFIGSSCSRSCTLRRWYMGLRTWVKRVGLLRARRSRRCSSSMKRCHLLLVTLLFCFSVRRIGLVRVSRHLVRFLEKADVLLFRRIIVIIGIRIMYMRIMFDNERML